MPRTIVRRFAGAIFTGLLLACGTSSTPAGQLPPPTAPSSAGATAPSAPATAAPVAAQPAQAPAATAAAPTASQAEPTAAAAGGIPEGVTAEGYHYLGRPDAPATLVMYSDFL
jgi:hypothetical protein